MASFGFVFTLLVIALSVTGGALVYFLARERSLNRFDAGDPHRVTADWLEQNIFKHPPEVLGAAWEGEVGSHQVQAVLARMTLENKIESFIASPAGDPLLTLRLLKPWNELQGHELELARVLFLSGDTTDLTKLRSHYLNLNQANTPVQDFKLRFRPADAIRIDLTALSEKVYSGAIAGLQRDAPSHQAVLSVPSSLGSPDQAPGQDPLIRTMKRFSAAGITVLLLLSYGFGGLGDSESSPSLATYFLLAVEIGLFALAYFLAGRARRRVHSTPWAAASPAIPIILFLLFLAAVVIGGKAEIEALTVFWLVLLYIFFLLAVVGNASSPGDSRATEARRKLEAGRDFFRAEIQKGRPAVPHRWLPYLLAFDLGSDFLKWLERPDTAEEWKGSEPPFRGARAWIEGSEKIASGFSLDRSG